MKKTIFGVIGFFIIIFVLFSHSLWVGGKLPIPGDDLIGLYYPFRDLYAITNPNGIAYKNFLITDPIRQQYPWRELSISLEKNLELPLWNPYSLTGTPLLANFQSAAFYPLNVLYFVLPFLSAWSVQVLLQTILLGLFTFLYLRFLKLHPLSQLFGAIAISFCGFTIAWYEWNTIVQTFLWLPLILLAKEKLLQKTTKSWSIILLFAVCASLFAGHLQTFFYLCCVHYAYLIARIMQIARHEKAMRLQFALRKYRPFFFLGCVVVLITAIQWIPTFQLINMSARSLDQQSWQVAGWFIPWQNLIQFIAPDFFGNPATLNYFGVWNYGELVGYIGIIPLLFALYGIMQWKNWYVRFFSFVLLISFIFALPNVVAFLPFQLHIPFLSTAQPTRLLSLIDFSLVIIAAFGFDAFLHQKNKKIFIPLGILIIYFILTFVYLLSLKSNTTNYSVALHNLYLPLLLTVGTLVFISLSQFINKKNIIYIGIILIVITSFDLLRFSDKFLPFVSSSYIYPDTPELTFLQNHIGNNRLLTLNNEILPPNVSDVYHLQTIEGYDALYLQRYGQLLDYDMNNQADYNESLPFNRIVTDTAMSSSLMNFLGVKYVLSLQPIKNSQFKEVFSQGKTIIYENIEAFPRAFFVNNVITLKDKDKVLQQMFATNMYLGVTAYIEQPLPAKPPFIIGQATITSYQANKVVISTNNPTEGFLVLTDSWYPTWHVTIDGKESKLYLTDYNYRGVLVPEGKHTVQFTNSLW